MHIDKKNTGTETTNLLDGFNSILDTTVERVSELEKRSGKSLRWHLEDQEYLNMKEQFKDKKGKNEKYTPSESSRRQEQFSLKLENFLRSS